MKYEGRQRAVWWWVGVMMAVQRRWEPNRLPDSTQYADASAGVVEFCQGDVCFVVDRWS